MTGRYKVIEVVDHDGMWLGLKIEPVPSEALRMQFEMLMAQEMAGRHFDCPANMEEEVRATVQRILDQLSQ